MSLRMVCDFRSFFVCCSVEVVTGVLSVLFLLMFRLFWHCTSFS